MPGCITRLDPIDVMYVREFEKPDEEAFAELEAVVGLKGRRLLRGLRRRWRGEVLGMCPAPRARRPSQSRP